MRYMRVFVAIILGYLCLFAVAFSVQTVAYIVLGSDRVFKSGAYDISNLWIAVTLVAGLVGAMFGGYICRFVGGSAKPAFYLAGLIVLIGFAFGFYGLLFPMASQLGQGDVKMLNAMNVTVANKWLVFLHSCVCGVGVLAGAGMIKTPVKTKAVANGKILETDI